MEKMSVLCYHNVMAKKTQKRLTRAIKSSFARALAVATGSALWQTAHAAVYGGGGVKEGIGFLAGVGGITSISDLKTLLITIVVAVFDIILTVAMIVIIIAGIYLIASNGEEGNKDKAKKIILYCIIGIIVILLSRLIVVLVNHIFG